MSRLRATRNWRAYADGLAAKGFMASQIAAHLEIAMDNRAIKRPKQLLTENDRDLLEVQREWRLQANAEFGRQ